MSKNKLSRCTFLTAGSAFIILRTPVVRAPELSGSANTQDYNSKDWIASFRQAFKGGQTVVVPNGLECKDLNTAIVTPFGKTPHLQSKISGSGRGHFVLQGGYKMMGDQGGSLRGVTLSVHGSDCVIRGVAMSGSGPVTQIYIGGKAPRLMRNLTIQSITVTCANYGILRQGFHNRVDDTKITNCRFSNLQGDAIEWSMAINDSNIFISDHAIERINCTNGSVNWGIGIGLVGSTYDNTCPDRLVIKNFVVANITGTDRRQLVHVENDKHFIIRNITARNVTLDFSKRVGINNVMVVIYGCDNFVIDNANMENSAGMLTGYGVIKGRYLSIPQDFKLNNIHLDNTKLEYKLRGIQIPSGNATPLAAITDVEMGQASLESHDQPQHLSLRNIRVMQQSTTESVLRMQFDLRQDACGRFMAKQDTLLSLASIHAVDESGRSSVNTDRVSHQVADVEVVNPRSPGRGR